MLFFFVCSPSTYFPSSRICTQNYNMSKSLTPRISTHMKEVCVFFVLLWLFVDSILYWQNKKMVTQNKIYQKKTKKKKKKTLRALLMLFCCYIFSIRRIDRIRMDITIFSILHTKHPWSIHVYGERIVNIFTMKYGSPRAEQIPPSCSLRPMHSCYIPHVWCVLKMYMDKITNIFLYFHDSFQEFSKQVELTQ